MWWQVSWSYSDEYWYSLKLMLLSADIWCCLCTCKKLSWKRTNIHDDMMYQHYLTKVSNFFRFLFASKASFFKNSFTTALLVQQRRYNQHWLKHLKICCFWHLCSKWILINKCRIWHTLFWLYSQKYKDNTCTHCVEHSPNILK